jgi:hypothetical protein
MILLISRSWGNIPWLFSSWFKLLFANDIQSKSITFANITILRNISLLEAYIIAEAMSVGGKGSIFLSFIRNDYYTIS